MPTVYCYPVKLTIADLIRAKSICLPEPLLRMCNWGGHTVFRGGPGETSIYRHGLTNKYSS